MTEKPEDYMSQTELSADLTRAELALIRGTESFSRWSMTLHKSVAESAVSYRDIAVLHSIRLRGNAQNLSELLLFLNRNDVSTLQYSLKKLEKEDFVKRVVGNSKREAGYELTEKGLEATGKYAEVREQILVQLLSDHPNFCDSLETAAAAFERLAGLYDQATQSVMNRDLFGK